MISCRDAVRQLWDFLDGAIADADRRTVEEHLSFCRRCCGEVEFAHELRAFLASQASAGIPPEVHARLLSVIDELTEAG